MSGVSDVSVVPMVVFIVSAMICLGASAACHLYYALSYRYSLWLSTADYTGITCLITGSFFPPIVYGLHCNPIAKRVYCVCVALLSLIVISAMLSDKYSSDQYFKTRVGLFLALGLFGLLPVGQHFLQYGMTDMLYHLLCMTALYVLGIVIWVFKIPERWFPGKLDYVGNSHLIWHILVLLAALVHYRGSYSAYLQVQELEDGICPRWSDGTWRIFNDTVPSTP